MKQKKKPLKYLCVGMQVSQFQDDLSNTPGFDAFTADGGSRYDEEEKKK